MFKVKNLTTSDIVLADLRLVLGGGKTIDLDQVSPRHKIERSDTLRQSISNKRIKIVSRDPESVDKKVQDNSLDIQALTDSFERSMEKKLRQAIEFKDDQISQLATAVNALIGQMSGQGQGSSEKSKNLSEVSSEDGDGISDEMSRKIHAKAMKRMSQKVQGHVDTKGTETTSQDDSLAENIDALNDLLGLMSQ